MARHSPPNVGHIFAVYFAHIHAKGNLLSGWAPIFPGNYLLLGFAQREFQGGLPLVDLLSGSQPSCFLVVLVVLISRVLACSCPLFWVHGRVVSFPHSPFTLTFTSNWWILISSTAIFCRSLWWSSVGKGRHLAANKNQVSGHCSTGLCCW